MKTLFLQQAFIFVLISSPVFSQWIEQTLPGNSNVTLGIDFLNQNQGITGGWYGDISQQIYGQVYYTYDGGSNWVQASVPDSIRVMVKVQMINENLSYAAGAYNLNTKKESINNSVDYSALNPLIKNHYENFGMDFSGQENYRGYFIETTDGGQSWHPKGSFIDSVYYLVGLYFIDQQTGFVIATSQGASGHAILKTTDSGNSWYYVYPFQEPLWIEDIKFVDSLSGIAVGEITATNTGVILKTSDGGENWNEQYVADLTSIFSVAYTDLSTIFIGGIKSSFQAAVYKSTDGGLIWQESRAYSGAELIQGINAFLNSGYLLVYGTTYITQNYIPFVDISSDGGNNWNYFLLSQFQDYIPVDSKMVDELRWYLTGTQNVQSGFVLFTDNAGGVPVELVSFTAEAVDGKINLSWTTATELNNLGFEIERKSDSEDWRMIGFIEGKGTTTETQNYNFVDDLFGVADSRIFYRLKQIDFNGTYDYLKEIEVERAPASFSLEQNYPNPFNPTTKIKFTIPGVETRHASSLQMVTLKVFDILGNEIATLVNEELPAGEYEVEFNSHSGLPSGEGRNLPSGVYFYQLRIGGPETSSGQKLIQTKKMILIR